MGALCGKKGVHGLQETEDGATFVVANKNDEKSTRLDIGAPGVLSVLDESIDTGRSYCCSCSVDQQESKVTLELTTDEAKRVEKIPPRSPSVARRMSFHGRKDNFVDSSDAVKLIIVTDPGQDNDDEMALMLMNELVLNGKLEPLAVVANLLPSARRAALARSTLDMLGLQHVPVGIGTDGGSTKHTDTFSDYISTERTGLDYISGPLDAIAKLQAAAGTPEAEAISHDCRIFEGHWLLRDVLERAEDQSVTFLLISSIKDAAQLLREHEQLFVAKVKCVTIMGGVQWDENQAAEQAGASNDASSSRLLLPDVTAHNNCFDLDAAKFFYQRCQELGVPLVILSRFTAYGCPVPRQMYDLMVRCPVPHPVACRLHAAQKDSIERLWRDVCTGGKLPPRCDKTWYCDTFCGGLGYDRTVDDSMWDIVKNFNMYDPLALLAAMPAQRDHYFTPVKFVGLKGVTHIVIGIDKQNSGILADKAHTLRDYLLSSWVRAAGRPRRSGEGDPVDDIRPAVLDVEKLTACLNPMQKHAEVELNEITSNVLRLLDNEWPQLKNSSLLDTWRQRDRLMREVGPPMLLLDWRTLEDIGRIPHSDEERGITMEEAESIAKKQGYRFFIEMFSHRWSSPYSPDDRYNSKAKVLIEWAKYRESCGLRTFFWIDYTCINQSDIAPGVAMLPLYVSSCNNIVCFDTPEYLGRAWCRVERLMFAAFVAPNNEFISRDFRFVDDAERLPNNELKPVHESRALLPDPAQGELSYAADMDIIDELKNLCSTHWNKCWKDGLLTIVEDKVGLKGVRSLQLGTTEVRMRTFGLLKKDARDNAEA